MVRSEPVSVHYLTARNDEPAPRGTSDRDRLPPDDAPGTG